MLQETHITLEDEENWSREWGGQVIYSHGTRSSRGTCIMFAPHMDLTIHRTCTDENGRFVIIDVTINETRLTLANIYGPNEDDEVFYECP